MWAAGVAGGGAVVAWWRIVGRGFDWLIAATAALLAALAAMTGAGIAGWVAAGLAAIAFAVGGRAIPVTALLGSSAIAALVAGVQFDGAVFVVAGALALGGITTEMLLGHWFLVDPRLPRISLRRLAVAGVAGAAADLLAASLRATDGLGTWLGVGLGATTIVLMVLVALSLREKGYSGVMAATGLSYLALLTGAGAVALVRAAAAGAVAF